MKNAVFWMWPRVSLLRKDVSEEHVASVFRVEKTQRAKKRVSSLLTVS
jgi:hypothetical protein